VRMCFFPPRAGVDSAVQKRGSATGANVGVPSAGPAQPSPALRFSAAYSRRASGGIALTILSSSIERSGVIVGIFSRDGSFGFAFAG